MRAGNRDDPSALAVLALLYTVVQLVGMSLYGVEHGLTAGPGTVALLCAMIGTTSFDGLTAGPLSNSISTWMIERLNDLGLGQQLSIEVAFTIGLLATVALVYGLYRLGIEGVRSLDRTRSASGLA